ncbi:hypothetical protein H9N25_12445 [Pedobacter riviphilus]|uniref:Uncharacterized protein n=1 Tax=Pedobacter riviphilus TaxID=2766984 RepID=A0ABX6TC75_9SPHI|nr:hypothetical protein [Pedobacter riviphilus]QNR82806.1 hypothetical protein H9N25_12445 [Pedobacter riviphilus]
MRRTLSFKFKKSFWKATAVLIGFDSPAPVPAPMKNREHPLRSGLDGRDSDAISVLKQMPGTGSASKNQPLLKRNEDY